MGAFLGKCCQNAASSADQRIAAENGKHRTGPLQTYSSPPILRPKTLSLQVTLRPADENDLADCPNLAQMRSPAMSALSPLLEHKRTYLRHRRIDANDPPRTYVGSKCRIAAVSCHGVMCYPFCSEAQDAARVQNNFRYDPRTCLLLGCKLTVRQNRL